MSGERVHAFGDDALGVHDAVGPAQPVRARAVSPGELAAAAAARARRIDAALAPARADCGCHCVGGIAEVRVLRADAARPDPAGEHPPAAAGRGLSPTRR